VSIGSHVVPSQQWNDPPGLRWPGLTFDSFRKSLKTRLATEELSDSFEYIGACFVTNTANNCFLSDLQNSVQ